MFKRLPVFTALLAALLVFGSSCDVTEPDRVIRGPVIKSHASQAYATDAASSGHFTALCRHLDIDPQYFVSRSDLPCGSTIGPVSAAQTGIRTVDVGNPMLSMHSCREMSGTADVEPMVKVLRQFLMT